MVLPPSSVIVTRTVIGSDVSEGSNTCTTLVPSGLQSPKNPGPRIGSGPRVTVIDEQELGTQARTCTGLAALARKGDSSKVTPERASGSIPIVMQLPSARYGSTQGSQVSRGSRGSRRGVTSAVFGSGGASGLAGYPPSPNRSP
jgi:hypothetical protein